jgi:hypothetical protein
MFIKINGMCSMLLNNLLTLVTYIGQVLPLINSHSYVWHKHLYNCLFGR